MIVGGADGILVSKPENILRVHSLHVGNVMVLVILSYMTSMLVNIRHY